MVHAIKCNDCNTKHFAGYSRCASRWCPACAHVRSIIYIAQLVPIVEEWISDGKYVFMLNFTIRNEKDLPKMIKRLYQCYRELSNGNKRVRERWKSRFVGGIRSLEVTKGVDGDWHAHYHCLVFTDRLERDYEWLRDEWKRISGRYGTEGSIWLKGMKRRGILKSICEVVKYILKFDDSFFAEGGQKDLHTVYYSLMGVRQIATWGFLRGLVKAVDREITSDKIEGKKIEQFICSRCGCTSGKLIKLMYDDDLYLYDPRE